MVVAKTIEIDAALKADFKTAPKVVTLAKEAAVAEHK
jgi:hypothetical protein